MKVNDVRYFDDPFSLSLPWVAKGAYRAARVCLQMACICCKPYVSVYVSVVSLRSL